MSDNTNNPTTNELLAALLKAQSQPQPAPQGAITFGGINKYWPQIVAAVVVGLWLNTKGEQQAILVSRVATVEEAVKSISQVKADQAKSSGEVQVLQVDVTAIKAAQKDQATKLDNISSSLATVGQQISSISQALRGR